MTIRREMDEGYEWVTDDMFDSTLESLVDGMSGAEILRITGVYEVLREELNNDVLSVLEEQRDREQTAEPEPALAEPIGPPLDWEKGIDP